MIILSSTVFLWLTCFFHSNFAIQVKVQQGVLDGGFSRLTRNGTTYYTYYGIPYAKPPVGELRFEAPQEPLSWTGVRNTSAVPPPGCIQKNARLLRSDEYNLTIGQEDCLYLNVFTPKGGSVEASSSHLLPVVVFIHGGGFQYGGGIEPQRYFMDHNVVLVSFDFRLAVFGFLSTGDKILPGNMGLKDQVAALRWIQKNIAAFGGDPKRVTIVGSGSGATSIHLHMYSPLSVGLFHRAISTSGTALNMGTMVPTHIAKGRARDLGKTFGCQPETEKLVECLKKVPAEYIIAWLPNIMDLAIEIVSRPFAVVVEEENEGAFLTKNPWRYDAPNRVPWIVGINADEGCLPVARLQSFKSLDKVFQHYERTFPDMFFYRHFVSAEDASNISDLLKMFYFSDSDIDSVKDIEKILTLYTDANYAMSAMSAVERFNQNKTKNNDNTAPVYLYLLDHRNHSTVENLGVCNGHSDDVDFFFGDFFPPIIDALDILVSESLVDYAVNFINDGDPNDRVISEGKENTPSNQSSLNFGTNVQRKIWSPVRSSNFEYLHVKYDDSGVMDKNLFNKRYRFWKKNIFPFFESNPLYRL